jgi:hypothetical protein
MADEILRTIYLSKATCVTGRRELTEMTRKFSMNNARLRITGTLLRIGNYYVQVLEGPEDAVDSLFTIIKEDHRHEGVTILARYLDGTRVFGDWGMNCADLDSRYYVNLAETAKLRAHLEDFLRKSPTRSKAMLATLTRIQQHIRSQASSSLGKIDG